MASPESNRDLSDLQRPLDQFRAKGRRLKVHPAETRVLWVVAAHLVFLPWALGGMRPWAHWISLGLAALGLALSLLPREYTEEHTGSNRFRLIMWPKLVRFPIFWLGAALLALITIQGLNPAWTYKTNGTGWWMQQIEHREWLPVGVEAPFERWNQWRVLLVYTSAWLTVCSLWIGFTRRRTIQSLAMVIAGNGLAVAVLGVIQKLTSTAYIFWTLPPPPAAVFFASFIYKNHAAAFLYLPLVITCGLATWYYLRGIRKLEKSNPAGVFAFFAICIATGIVVSYARGATLTSIVFLSVAVAGFVIHQLLFVPERRITPLVAMLLLFGVFLHTGYEALRMGESWQRISHGLSGRGDLSFQRRMLANQSTTEMLREHWLRGIGAGSFSFLFPAYQKSYPALFVEPSNPARRQFWSHAHNDILQIPLELGLAGTVIIIAGVAYWLITLVRRYFWQNAMSTLLVFGALLLVGYSYFDFPFYCPAVLLLWCCLWPLAAIWAKLEEPER